MKSCKLLILFPTKNPSLVFSFQSYDLCKIFTLREFKFTRASARLQISRRSIQRTVRRHSYRYLKIRDPIEKLSWRYWRNWDRTIIESSTLDTNIWMKRLVKVLVAAVRQNNLVEANINLTSAVQSVKSWQRIYFYSNSRYSCVVDEMLS